MQTYREILQKKFSAEYDKLNPEQRKAVDSIEGPVMVVAGPGTGKTQILAARIGKILLETDVLPQNILCLTYTEAGSLAMRRRLLKFIGPDAYRVNIYTFHAFCNDVIQENLSMFEKTALNPISDLERIRIFKTLIDGFDKTNILKKYRGDVYFEIRNMQQLFSAMKREGWSSEYITERIHVYLERIKDDDKFRYKSSKKGEYNKGDYKPSYEDELLRMEKLFAAVSEFENFQALMHKNNFYDFDDMINWVIKAFNENKNLLASYQERFQYILVDEYQDTSGTQNEIVKLLVSFWESPNVFVVGDDDQSIFRFQGANVENMQNFAESYEDLLKIVLTSNYRSTQPILDISKSLIERNTERLIKHEKFKGLSKNLISSHPAVKHLTHNPTVVEYNTVKDEMADITNKVAKLIDSGVEPGRIAVIYKENIYGEQLIKYLKQKNIPVFSRRNINILQEPFAKKILHILRYLVAEHEIPYSGDQLLFEIMHFDFYKIKPIDIAKISIEVNQKNYGGAHTSMRRLLYERANALPRDLFDPGLEAVLKNFSKMIEQLIADVSNCTVQKLFEKVILNAGVLGYIMKSEEKIRLMQMLTALFDFIKEETARNPLLDLQGIISVIDLMEQEKIWVQMAQVSGNDTGVNLLTAHGSKGLEFEHVFVTSVNAYLWEKKRKFLYGYKFPDTLFSSLPEGSEEEELRRLFYVALTRAEKNLQVSYINFNSEGKETEHSMFIAEIVLENNLPIERVTLPDEELMEFEMLNYTSRAPEIQKTEEEFITAILDNYVMNVSSLNNYLACPLQFYFRNVIKIPFGQSENLAFGSAVHFAIQKFFEDMQKDVAQHFPSKIQMVEYFKWYMIRHREHFTKEAFERKMEYGEEILSNYYDNYITTWNRVVAVERNIRNVVINGVPIKGKVDKLEFKGNEVNVVDYKTGDVNSNFTTQKLSPPSEKNTDGGDYWRQAVFYKMLVDNMGDKNWKVVSTEFDFIEPDKRKGYQKRKVFIHPGDIETVSQQITRVWQKIQAHDFYTGCGKEDCHWCNFVKNNKMEIALHEIVEEAEEEI